MAKRAYTIDNIEAMRYERLNWDDWWAVPFGNPAVNSSWFILGPSASGKSSFVMQLGRELCRKGKVLYVSYEEGVRMEFQRRLKYLHMDTVKTRFSVVTDDTLEELTERLSRPRSARFVIIDSFQYSGWSYEQAKGLVDLFPKKGFIFVSQEYKGQPLGKAAIRLRYMADMKIRVAGYKAYCQGRATGEPGAYYRVWEEGIIKTSNNY
ncbi:MAG: AAA family ATPase [Bacteroidaceae bacterium]|nr:AAA family ATPase [Bacteroidaceae bacterium]